MTEIEPWTCPTCHSAVSTPYCPGCGERPLRDRELTLLGIFDQLVLAFTSLDSRLIRSVRCLVGRPGFLTVAYLEGQRKRFVGPVSLFLMANALFFAIESMTGGKSLYDDDRRRICTLNRGAASQNCWYRVDWT